MSEWLDIKSAPADGRMFFISSGPVPGTACCSNVEMPGCEVEWSYDTGRTRGWTNNLEGLATHWMPLPPPPTLPVEPPCLPHRDADTACTSESSDAH